MDIKTILGSAAASALVVVATVPAMVNFVTLQAASPGTAETGNSNITGNSIAGRFGAGTTPTISRVQVSETGPLIGVRTVTNTGDAINALANSTTGASITGRFVNSSSSGKAILGENISTTGNAFGGDFKARSVDGGAALLGRHIAPTGPGTGVNGTSASATGNAGVFLNTNLSSGAKIGGPGGSILTSGTLPNHQYTNNSTAAMVPVAYGFVFTSGSINSGSGNFTVTKPGTGQYDIDVQGITIANPNLLAITAIAFENGGDQYCSQAFATNGDFRINVFDQSSNALVDSDFSFVVYRPQGFGAGPQLPDYLENPAQLKKFGDFEAWQKADMKSFQKWFDAKQTWIKEQARKTTKP